MALDRAGHDQDSVRADKAGHRGSGADAATERSEPAETRSRAEYYAARTSDDLAVSADESHRSQAERPERSGWNAVDAENRPPLDAIRITPERRTHILDGDAYGGGHRHGTGRPGKTEFPATWDDETIIDKIHDAVQHPDSPPVYQDWNERWLCVGTRDSVEVSVIVLCSGEVWTAWPEPGGPGVVRNPRKGTS
jgi:hypothetical protein